ncbi:unnamed protein product [Paramecium primaurelia]|uniref:Uncharacterized protein n=1 Tax=Paramecium primaurelia TaxID=5886 RepID=A0A8S1N7I8_PARPR|nr:unnamed protein product [Paramecium primaurelia]CAD8088718.1 unnamed protein product [Paramecium primaurelia]
MALQLQNKLQQVLMVFEDTFRNSLQQEMSQQDLQERATYMVQNQKELITLIDKMPDVDDSIQKNKLQEYFLEKDIQIDRHNQLKKELNELSEIVDTKIQEFFTQQKL